MKTLIKTLIITISFSSCFAQKNSKFELINWKAEDCDNTYDPFKLQNRITDLKSKDDKIWITINFADNCCAEFQPKVKFKGKKIKLFPYEAYLGDYCTCECCFSITYEIKGVESKELEIYFNDIRVFELEDHYKTVKPDFQDFGGRKINRKNKYGFKEGLWIEFYENKKIKSKTQYPESSIYYEPYRIWKKEFFESGELSFYSRKDTIESWFIDGELKTQIINYSNGDTTFQKTMKKHENRQLKEASLYRRYPTIHTSEFDPEYNSEGEKWGYIYKETFYLNGQIKYLENQDTSCTWFENGQLKIESNNFFKQEYDSLGNVIKRHFYWKKPGMKGWGDLNNSLSVEYNQRGKIQRIHLRRDEMLGDNKSLAPNLHYEWKWNEKQILIDSPENWDEEYPWINIKEIKLSPTMHSRQ